MTRSLDELDAQAKVYGGGQRSDRFEFDKTKKQVYKMRLLNFPEVLATHFFGKGNPSAVCVGMENGCIYHGGEYKSPSLKLVMYIIDRTDGVVKLAELPLSVRYALKDLQEDEDFAFADFPMPYDVKITSDPANDDPKAKYRLVGSPNKVALTPEEEKAFEEAMAKMTPAQYVEKRKAKTKTGTAPVASGIPSESNVPYPTAEEEGITPDDIPF